MSLSQFEVLGFWDNDIFFRYKDKIISLKKNLPKEDLILKLKVQPEDVKALKDEILVQASNKPLTYDQKEEFVKERA